MKKGERVFARPLVALLVAGVVVACAVPLFHRLGQNPLGIWDEARHALSAFEMSRGTGVLVTSYEWAPDMWNTKPPLMVWLQTISMLVFGPNELAARLPSALAALATVVLLLWYATRVLGKPRVGLVAALVLVLSHGYVRAGHVARDGDVDALLTFFTTLYGLAYFEYLREGSRRWLWTFAGALFLGAMTKDIAAFLPAPGLLVYTIAQRRLGVVLRAPAFWAAVAAVVAGIAAWYTVRELAHPGYLHGVWIYEISGRYLEVNDGHAFDRFFYLRNLWGQHFAPFAPFALAAAVAGFFTRDRRGRDLQLLVIVWCAVFLLVVSSSKTRLWWYDAPLFPFLALLLGLGLEAVCERILDPRLASPWLRGAIVAAVVGAGLTPTYLATLQAIRVQRQPITFEREGAYMRKLRAARPELVHYSVYMDVPPMGENDYGQLDFYVETFRARGGGGSDVTIVRDGKVAAGDVVLSCSKGIVTRLRAGYVTRDVAAGDGCTVLELGAPRS